MKSQSLKITTSFNMYGKKFEYFYFLIIKLDSL